MLSCREITELVTDYVEGKLPTIRRLSFEMHLAMCANCKRYVEQLARTVKTLGRLPDEPIPEDVMTELKSLFGDSRERREAEEDDTEG